MELVRLYPTARQVAGLTKMQLAAARRDFAHKLSHALVDRYDTLVFEKLNVRAMTRSARGTLAEPGTNVRAKAGMNREILHAGWSILFNAARVIKKRAELRLAGSSGALAPDVDLHSALSSGRTRLMPQDAA